MRSLLDELRGGLRGLGFEAAALLAAVLFTALVGVVVLAVT